MRPSVAALLAFALGLTAACSRGPTSEPQVRTLQSSATGEMLTVTLAMTPDPPRSGDNAVELSIQDAERRPVTDATVAADFYMPAMPSMNMPEMHSEFVLSHREHGVYVGKGSLEMAGTWNVNVTIGRKDARDTVRFTVIAR